MSGARRPALPVWQEFAEAGADAGKQKEQQAAQPQVGSAAAAEDAGRSRRQQAAKVPLGSAAAAAWLAALSRWAESAEGARAKAALNELLRCGSRARDKTVAVANSARQAIAAVFRCGGAGAACMCYGMNFKHAALQLQQVCRTLSPPTSLLLPSRRIRALPPSTQQLPFLSLLCSWTHHAEDPPGTDNPAWARECLYLFER